MSSIPHEEDPRKGPPPAQIGRRERRKLEVRARIYSAARELFTKIRSSLDAAAGALAPDQLAAVTPIRLPALS